MPVFAFGFGSFGDILAAVQLAVRIAIILRQSGNSTESAETEKELKALSCDLDLADRTLQQTAGSPLASFVAARIRDEVVQCHKLMARFFMKITTPQSLVQKIRWAASQEKELAKLKTQIIERRSALGLVMDVINSGALMAVRDHVDDVGGQCTMVSATLPSSFGDVGGQVRHGHTLIQDVQNGVSSFSMQLDEVGGQVRHGHTQIQDVHNGVSSVAQRLDETASAVLLQQLATYHEQVIAVIRHVPDGISEAMFVVISPIGIPIPISLTFCTSYNLLDDILKRYMRGRKEAGGHYVERGDYSIVSPEGDTILPPTFIRTLTAGLLQNSRAPKSQRAPKFQRAPNKFQRAPSKFQRAPNKSQRAPNKFQREPNKSQGTPKSQGLNKSQGAPSKSQGAPNKSRCAPKSQRAPKARRGPDSCYLLDDMSKSELRE
ncbi:hypothetical protein DFH09DRAFT_1369322 [Mycena vulgaris]|nr:hypothetical protein DFH09DRAFT_1369322 [Mycena vulgaris]